MFDGLKIPKLIREFHFQHGEKLYGLPFLNILFLLLMLSCGGSLQNKNPVNQDGIQKITVTRGQVYDLSGYAYDGGGSPFGLFDENKRVDPRNEKAGDGDMPVTNCQPTIHPSIYFHGATGSRIVVDLRISYRIKEIYFCDRSQTADSFWIYGGNLKNWKIIYAGLTVSQPGNWGWKKIIPDEETRFLMIRFASYESDISEMVLYGTPLSVIPPDEDFSRHKGFTKSTLSHFLGVNYIMEQEPRWLMPFHYSRLYNFALDFDNDTNRDISKVHFNMLHYGYFNKEKNKYVFDIDTLKNINRGEIWFSIRGVSDWMSRLGYSDKDRPLNEPGLNSEKPESYSRHAKMLWNMAAFFGYQKWDTNLLSISNHPLQSGRGSMNVFENGNEEDATWVGNKYCWPYAYFAQSTADWDGDEGRLGQNLGLHSADPKARLMTSGMIGLDTNRVKVYDLLSKNLRNDQSFIWQGGIQYHYYATDGRRGLSPEEDSMRFKLSKVADCSYRIAPDVPCFLGENGYDKSVSSRQSTPRIPGLTMEQSQATMLLRSINATFFSGFDAYILYWLRDGVPSDDPRVYLTSGLIRTLPDGKTVAYPAWFQISTLINRLGGYLADRIVQESANVWIYKYRSALHPDSVAYFIYKPSENGSKIASWSMKMDDQKESAALKIHFQDKSEPGREEIVAVKNGIVSTDVAEEPILILYKERPLPK